MKASFLNEKGQMSVELVVCLPVILIVAFIAIHGMIFAAACARFDEITPQFVRVEATKGLDESVTCHVLESGIKEALSVYPGISIAVTSEWIDGITGDEFGEIDKTYFIVPHHTRYRVLLSYLPVGLPSSIFGFEITGIIHQQSFAVDSYKPGIWM